MEEKIFDEEKFIDDLDKMFNVRVVSDTLDSYNYTVPHLQLIVSKLLLERHAGSVTKSLEFLKKYDKSVLDNAELE